MAKIYFPSKSSIHKGELLVFNLIIWVRGRTQSWHNLGPKRDGGGPLHDYIKFQLSNGYFHVAHCDWSHVWVQRYFVGYKRLIEK